MQNASYAKVTQNDEDAAAAAASSYNGDTPLLTIPEQGSMTMTAVVASSPTVQVEAPADLPEGYEFQATLPGQQCMIKVTVPPGGVEKGQYFSVPLPTNAVGAQFLNDGLLGSGGSSNGHIISIPVGHWRDGLFEFYKYGICHPHCWTACCCSTLAAGQVISRLKLQWNGKPGTVAQAAGAFPIIFGLVLFYWAVRLALSAAVIYIDPQRAFADPDDLDSLPPPSASFITAMILIDLWFYLSWVVMAVILYNVRRTTRQMYGIPVRHCGESEDCLVSTFCPCFAAGQLLRHTTQYDIYPATCCTERGIPPHAPSIV